MHWQTHATFVKVFCGFFIGFFKVLYSFFIAKTVSNAFGGGRLNSEQLHQVVRKGRFKTTNVP